jgi:hypothetical protein
MLEARTILSAGTILRTEISNLHGEALGTIISFGIDVEEGQIAYAVVAFGGVLGFGDKWFAVPWEALEYSRHDNSFVLNVDKDFLTEAPGFEKDHWPDVLDRHFAEEVYKYYGRTAYWEKPALQLEVEGAIPSRNADYLH